MDVIPKLVLKNVDKVYSDSKRNQKTIALGDVSLEVMDGEFACLLGPSGCGKSTILNLVAAFENPTNGEVLLDGEPVSHPGPDRGMVFQTPELYPWLSVLDNITLGARINKIPVEQYSFSAERYIRLMGLSGFERHYPYELSGGMKQRVALARAWIMEPGVFLMDEPFGALDAQTRLMMQELLLLVWEEAQRTVLFVTHDVDEGIFLADEIYVMSARPGAIREKIPIKFDRPRQYEELIFQKDYSEIKKHVLHLIREETLKLLESGDDK